jgi:hypothetical protein
VITGSGVESLPGRVHVLVPSDDFTTIDSLVNMSTSPHTWTGGATGTF